MLSLYVSCIPNCWGRRPPEIIVICVLSGHAYIFICVTFFSPPLINPSSCVRTSTFDKPDMTSLIGPLLQSVLLGTNQDSFPPYHEISTPSSDSECSEDSPFSSVSDLSCPPASGIDLLNVKTYILTSGSTLLQRDVLGVLFDQYAQGGYLALCVDDGPFENETKATELIEMVMGADISPWQRKIVDSNESSQSPYFVSYLRGGNVNINFGHVSILLYWNTSKLTFT